MIRFDEIGYRIMLWKKCFESYQEFDNFIRGRGFTRRLVRVELEIILN